MTLLVTLAPISVTFPKSVLTSVPVILLFFVLVSPLPTLALSSNPAPLLSDHAPSWTELQERVFATDTGRRLKKEAEQRAAGHGPPHTDAKLRLFSSTNNEDDVRVTFFRDSAAWCPYCQKTWVLLEEKKIPYRVQKVPLNAYGDKPAWYTRKVDGGKLPAIELDGELHVESLHIMKLLDNTFTKDHGPRMFPSEEDNSAHKVSLANSLLSLEGDLQREWFSLVFYPVKDEALEKARSDLMDTLYRVDEALSLTSGPWFLGGETPSIVDIQYIATFERLIASALYWKGLVLRGKYANIDLWLDAFEERPSYLATKADYFTHIMAIPSQNGPGYHTDESKDIANKIYGLNDAWKIPLNTEHEPFPKKQTLNGDEAARHEAAFELISNHENIVQFACRGAGEPGRPSFHAELADPYSEPNEDFFTATDVCLRHVTVALLDSIDKATSDAILDLSGQGGSGELRPSWDEYEDDDGRVYYWNDETGCSTYTPPTQQLDTCVAYLRDRVGVPRDMGQGAAMQLRCHLNWAIDLLK